MNILVLGGNGFIGQEIVLQLQRLNQANNALKQTITCADGGLNVRVGSRNPRTATNQIAVHFEQMLTVEDWIPVLKGMDIVVNAVGILRERKGGETYEKVHTLAPAAIALACAKLGIKMIHISAIGLSMRAKSRFIRSKYLGEQAILSSGAELTIVRPSLLDGAGGYGAKWFRRVSSWSMQLVMQSDGLIAPLQVSDLGEAVARLCLAGLVKMPKIIELGGEAVLSIPQYLNYLRASRQRNPAVQIAVPKIAVRVASHLFDMLAWTPLSFGHFELMQGNNVPLVNWLPILLGRSPSPAGWAHGLADKNLPKKSPKIPAHYLDPLEAA